MEVPLYILFSIKVCVRLLNPWMPSMKLPATHPFFPGVFFFFFFQYFRASESTKINHIMRSDHRPKIRFQDVVYE